MKTTIFLGLMTGLVMAVGYLLGGQSGMLLALGLSAVMNFAAYWWSDKFVLATYGAKEARPEEYRELYALVRELAAKASMPEPRVFVVDTQMPNAFATGRNEKRAIVAVTTGLLQALGREELKGVLAHELMHIKNKDMLISSVAATMAGAISYLVQMAYFASFFGGGDDEEDGGGGIFALLLTLILAPLVSALLQFAVSRSREYMADRDGARLAGNPQGLAAALAKLESFSQSHILRATPRQETAGHLFIVNPFKASALTALFSTHPPMRERLARLKALAL